MRGRGGWIAVTGLAVSLCAAALVRQELTRASPPPASTPASVPEPVKPAVPREAPPRLPPSLDGRGKAQVRVVSAKEQRPLPGATVALLRDPIDISTPLETAVTNAQGIALFSEAPTGVVHLCARGVGHGEACEHDLGLVAGGSISTVLALPPGATLSGQVLNLDGTPAVGVRLMALSVPSHPRQMPTQAVTDANGRYILDGVTPGTVRIHPFTAEARAHPREAEVQAEAWATLDIQLAGFTPVTAKPRRSRSVRWRHFQPAADDDIKAVSVGVPLRRQDDGTWTGLVEAGNHTVAVTGYHGWRDFHGGKEVALSPGEPVGVQVPYDPSTFLVVGPPHAPTPRYFEFAGHVLLPDGTPAQGARIAVAQPPTYWLRCGNTTPTYQHVRFEGSGFAVKPAAGHRTVYAWLDDGRAGSVTVEGKEGERIVADIRLEDTGAVVGSLDPPAEPYFAQWPSVRVWDDDDRPLKRITGDGRFIIAGLPPGDHALSLEQDPKRHAFVIRPGQRTDLGHLRYEVSQ
ncbi:carboxypeptidase-like regulatory domain-containing protein [Myxococcus faecalis]|uniref:carboxypeptidase-like regulatory domain-containing protein n=1 Tax=Myxococcus faecalis TaxID=3115646 RepID=UPI003CE87BED